MDIDQIKLDAAEFGAAVEKALSKGVWVRKTDSKGRISLGVKDQYLTVQSRDDGSFVVTPLNTMMERLG